MAVGPNMSNLIVLGAQWGDEGKGKVVDLFSEHFDIVARYQGGHNAGHTVRIGDRKMILKLVPSGILRPRKRVVIGNGVVIDPAALIQELEALEAAGFKTRGRLFISSRAHVIFPFHPLLEGISEKRPGRVAIGTTSRGIGPCYEDKVARRGIRMAELLDKEVFRRLYLSLAEDKDTLRAAFALGESLDLEKVRAQYEEYAERLRPMVTDTAHLLNTAIAAGQRVLFEGAQGTMLDIDHGTYPFVTSSSASAGGAATGSGVPPSRIGGVVGISKAYITRVGGGPFPTEAGEAAAEELRNRGSEYGAVTGRPRRCGWFDAPLLRYTAMINGFDTLVITKLDVLDHFEEILVCVGYKLAGKLLKEMPATTDVLGRVEPVYRRLPGWRTPCSGVTSWRALPARAKDYLRFLEEQTGVPIGAVSTGAERRQTIIVKGSRLEKLLRR